MAASISKLPTLATLPYDLLHAIVTHIPDARSLAALGRTCRALSNFISVGHGWQIFVQSRFPSIYPSIAPYDDNADASIDWRRHAEELTLLSKNYDRRGFVAHVLDPEVFVPHQNIAGRRRGRGSHGGTQMHRWSVARGKGRQTVGFHPVLDTCGDVLVVGAGQDILLRKRDGKEESWWVYEDRAQVAGRDDVTALKLFRGDGEQSQRALVGRANGALSCVVLQTLKECTAGVAASHVETVLETRGMVRSATLLEMGEYRLVASVLGNDHVALHKLPGESMDCSEKVPIASVLALWSTEEQPWTAQFLSSSMLVVGKNSVEPLALHAIIPTGLSLIPTRTFSAEDCVGSKTSSVQPIVSLPDIRGTSDLFLAGWHTGATLLHDIRSQKPYTASFTDPLDPTSAIYSLLPIGRERILVGGARHNLLKVFDIRMPGGRVYAYPGSSMPPGPLVLPSPTSSIRAQITPGWATYLSLLYPMRGFSQRNWGRERESPVYSLATGSPGGARVFAGVEGGIWEFDFAGEDVEPLGHVKPGQRSCTMYEFVGRTRLWVQGPAERMGQPGKIGACGGLDWRWE
ncbi:hypothetical protein K440DRAFT_662101 [Wilcoxina mikolae CBS 423.85]|nr:hypothetical protein K440DRAFT_662101 [Wilcoxina mikolae CBS 423.85]